MIPDIECISICVEILKKLNIGDFKIKVYKLNYLLLI